MRWLQWATYDLEKGLGGVEVHARCLARELTKLGVECHMSRDPRDLLDTSFDVIHTHGSGVSWSAEMRSLFTRRSKFSRPTVRIQAFHGETLGRMWACREWHSPRGVLAATREFLGLFRADVVLSDHDRIFLYTAAEQIGKSVAVASNGWDAFLDGEQEPLPSELREKLAALGPFWLFMGRGGDPVKGVDRLVPAIRSVPGAKLVANPGQGFENFSDVFRTGGLPPSQLKALVEASSGLVLTSYYEGLPLVVLEALALGVPVVATPVGGLVTLPPSLEGLVFARSGAVADIAGAIQKASQLANAPDARASRARANRAILPTWRQVAERAIEAVEDYRRGV